MTDKTAWEGREPSKGALDCTYDLLNEAECSHEAHVRFALYFDEAEGRATALEAERDALREAAFKARHRLLKEGFKPEDPTVSALIQALAISDRPLPTPRGEGE